jgi:hypothetical protein
VGAFLVVVERLTVAFFLAAFFFAIYFPSRENYLNR